MKITKKQLYKRQTTLMEIGEDGQQKLLQTKLVIVGCGGLGSAAAVYLAASGIGQIHLVDYDVVDASNLHRQVFYKTYDIGKPKAVILANHIEEISPFVKVSFSNTAISKSTVFDEISKYDFVLDCTDSLPIKYLLNDACVLKDKTLIYGSLYKYDGYVASFNVKLPDGGFTANLRDAFPEISKEAIPNCSEVGTLNTIVGIIGLMQANEVLKLVANIGKPLVNQLLIYNSLENSQFKMKLRKSFTKEKVQKLFDKENYYDASCEAQDESLLISAKTLKQKLLHGEASRRLHIISVVENNEIKFPFEVRQRIPLSNLKMKQLNFTNDNEYVIVCQRGISSYIATQQLKEKYPNLNVLSLKNGIINY
jgi:adenylyltransferase/sulfurtransferase